MSNATIMNPVAQVAAVRTITQKDIAEKLGVSLNTVRNYLNPNFKYNGEKVQAVRKAAKEMGYVRTNRAPVAQTSHVGTCAKCGRAYVSNSSYHKYCHECKIIAQREHARKHYHERNEFWHNGNFRTKEEEVARMKELRAMGYSNAEIAKAVGRSNFTVLKDLGPQDPELSLQNRAMAAHIRAQKNAARKQYVLNKPIREYNAKVAEHNALKAKVAQMEAEIAHQTPVIEKAAQAKITFPLVDLATLQPTALQ